MPTLILKTIKIRLFVLTMLPLLTACGTDHFDTSKSTSLVLPPIIQYERELLNEAANEIKAGKSPALTELAKDYKWTRDKIRVAKKELDDRSN